MRSSALHQLGTVVHAGLLVAILALAACSPEQSPASAAQTAAALRTPAAATARVTGAPPTLVPAGALATPQPQNSTAATPAGSSATLEPRVSTPTPAPAAVVLTASPNPVPVEPGRLSNTTITWNTGRADGGEVYVSVNGGPEQLFAAGTAGAAAAPWISPDATYDFRLYAGSNHSQLLASITVGHSANEQGAELTAEPNPVPLGDQDLGTTTVSWSTSGKEDGTVYVSVNGGPQQLFARGAKGSGEADWICPGHTYEFRLYQGDGQTNLLASTTVTRADPQPGQALPPFVRCPPPEGGH